MEKVDDVGGIWCDNIYFGCVCDILLYLYFFLFEFKVDWKYLFFYWDEILGYFKGVIDKYGLCCYIEFNLFVDCGYWDDDECCWYVFIVDGCEYVV